MALYGPKNGFNVSLFLTVIRFGDNVFCLLKLFTVFEYNKYL